jgi:hypothetical protein
VFTRAVLGWIARDIAVLCLLLLVTGAPHPALAQGRALTVARGLDQLTQEAELIVHGSVRSAKVEPHPQFPNLMTVVVSFDVQDTLKGKAQKSIQFRQYVWDIRDQGDKARYGKGEELLLMLGPVSKYGLTSPVGLEQGRFRILRDRSGQSRAINGRGNAGLFQQTEVRARTQGIKLSARQSAFIRQQQPGPVALSDLKDAIRTFARPQ